MAKISIFLVLLLSNTFIVFGQNRTHATSDLLKRIISTDNQIQKFETKYETSHSEHYEDYIRKYNYQLSRLLLKIGREMHNKNFLHQIAKKTDIKYCKSKDDVLTIFSWSVFNSIPNPSCSNVAFIGSKPIMLSMNGTVNNDFGQNIQIDTIIDIRAESKFDYLLIGSNKCDNLCVQQIASVYSISHSNLSKCDSAFYDGQEYLNDLEFDYLLNNLIKTEPHFEKNDNSIKCPIFNDDRTKLIKNKIYKIVPCN